MAEIKVNGVNLYYELHGPEEGEVIVLSNGIMMSTASWAFQTEALSKHFRVLLYDCRGMWRSEHPAGPYNMEEHADDLAALLKALQINKAHIAGISYGSEISMVFAIKYPELTKTLIVIDGVSQIDPLLRAQTLPWLMAAERNDPEWLMRTSVHLNFSEAWIASHQAYIDASVVRYAELDMVALSELMKAFYSLDITDQLRAITAPTLLIVGEDDLIKGRHYSEIIVNKIQNAEYVVVPGSGHALCLDKPDTLNTLLIGFVQKNQ
ncbi:MAG: alpha/beta hydrolase [Anaerolineaceae bacterium]|nr:alpha/beta hydrolase [Anaerolineaceae bacterium]